MHAHQISLIVEICVNVFTDFLRFSYPVVGELDECCVSIWKVLDLHLKERCSRI